MEEVNPMTALEARRAEVAQYEKNIELFEIILASLPNEYPANLIRFKGVKNQHEAIAEIQDLADVELISKLWYADECHKAIRSETVELTKSKAILAVLEAQAKQS